MSQQVAWGSWGANQLDLKGQVGKHSGSALVRWAGEDSYAGWWSKAKRSVRKVVHVAKPFVAMAATGAAIVFPPAAPLAIGVSVAVKALDNAERGGKAAMKLVKGTVAAAKADARKQPARRAVRQADAGGRWPRKARIIGTITFSGDESGAQRMAEVMRVVQAARKKARARGMKAAFVVAKTGHVMRVL